MDNQTKELIAIGASVTANCVSCLQFHLEKAQQVEVEEKQIRAAIRVGQIVRKGAANVWDQEATALLEKETTTVPGAEGEITEKACGCS